MQFPSRTILEPPRGSFSGIIPVQTVVARSDAAVVVLTEIRSYAEGCLFDFSSRTTVQSSVAYESGGFEYDSRLFLAPAADADPDPALLRFTVSQRVVGFTATSLHAGRVRSSDKVPESPVLLPIGGEVSREDGFRHFDQPVWLSPLPGPEQVTLTTSWPEFDIIDQHFVLDGARVVRASRCAERYPS